MPESVTARGPGRVNLIGEHTDYNGGLALPFAIARGISVRAEAIDGGRVLAHAADLGQRDAFPLADPGARGESRGWRAFVRGVVGELQAAGYELRPARLEIGGDLPRGAGLSSSAALSTALAYALLGIAGSAPAADLRELAKLCSRVENDWVGANTGLLDQLAVLYGSVGHALRIDFRSLDVQPVPLRLGGWQLATLESGATHSLAVGGYNERRAECEAACAALGIATLRDASPAAVETLADATLRARARHVVSENGRVDAMVAALERGELALVGQLLDASHASLRDDYASSVPEVEATVARAKAAGAAGARMVGGGFGGSVLALFAPGVEPPADALAVTPGAAAALV